MLQRRSWCSFSHDPSSLDSPSSCFQCLLLCWGYSLIQMLVAVNAEKTMNSPKSRWYLSAPSGHANSTSIITASVTMATQKPVINLANLLTLFLQFFEAIFLETLCDANCHPYLWWLYLTDANIITVAHVTCHNVG